MSVYNDRVVRSLWITLAGSWYGNPASNPLDHPESIIKYFILINFAIPLNYLNNLSGKKFQTFEMTLNFFSAVSAEFASKCWSLSHKIFQRNSESFPEFSCFYSNKVL